MGRIIVGVGMIVALWPTIAQLTGIDPFRPARVRQMAKLLCQAATAERAAQAKHDAAHGGESADEVAERGWLYIRTGEFLDRGLGHHVRQDFDAYNASEKKKLGDNFKLHKTRADYLERLAARLKSNDLAQGFVVPEDFSQFDHTKWPANNPN
ncbi:MAG: hypothetical protein HYS05_15475 [Acidobacteria bacterium]|nr:hypothetical protein [Acidobacteriota bacterium]